VRDDGLSTGHDGGRYDMFVVRFGKAVGSFQTLSSVDFSVVESQTHLVNEMTSPLLGPAGVRPTPDQFGGLFILEFLKNRGTPCRSIHPLGRQGEQEVPLEAWP
jgi:hypothetical protein